MLFLYHSNNSFGHPYLHMSSSNMILAAVSTDASFVSLANNIFCSVVYYYNYYPSLDFAMSVPTLPHGIAVLSSCSRRGLLTPLIGLRALQFGHPFYHFCDILFYIMPPIICTNCINLSFEFQNEQLKHLHEFPQLTSF